MRTLISCTAVALLLCGCGGGAQSPQPPTNAPPAVDQSIGGVWTGTDSGGLRLFALFTENGRLHWVTPATGGQGFGTGSVNGTAVTINYTYLAPLGSVLPDGSSSATCTATGTIQERHSLVVTTNCTTSLGDAFSNSASLTYDPLYDRDSSLSVIAGNYSDSGSVLNIAANGVVFEQVPETGCVINGQVSIIDSQFNAYDVLASFSNCIGNSAQLNGTTLTGLAILDNTATPEELIAALTGEIGGVIYSFVFVFPRI